MSTAIQTLLVELLTEELPPKALQKLGTAFAGGMQEKLATLGLLAEGCELSAYATPRRLAARFSAVAAQAPDQPYSEKLMPVKIGLDDQGRPTPALQKKLAAKKLEHLDPATLARESDGKQDYLVAHGTAPGASLAEGLQAALEHAIASLPIPKVMRYQLADGLTSVRFVRPAHGLIALHGPDIVAVGALGLQAGRSTRGHRFLAPEPIELAQADDYEAALATQGRVVASFTERRARIRQALEQQAQALGATLGDESEVIPLLDEVTALVELPAVYVGQFEEQFLQVPPECLILTMRLNQKYFPLFDPASGALTHRFLIVSNMDIADPANIVQGNQRVVRPRLADAQFFFQTDRKLPLAARVEQLGTVVYHNKLGSQRDRLERVRIVAGWLARQLGGDAQAAERAATLAKADLVCSMVGEFPELQGVMGAYYAAADGEAPEVVRALRDQYRNRLDTPVDAQTLTAAILFIADRTETLVGIWGIGLAPTGERDPYALRRAALGLISAFEQLTAGGWLAANASGPLALLGLLEQAGATLAGKIAAETVEQVYEFILERYRNQLQGEFDRNVVDAVLALRVPLHQVPARVRAVTAFARLPEAASLAAANKRIANLLKKTDGQVGTLDSGHLAEPAEQALAAAIAALRPQAEQHLAQGDFAAALSVLAQARAPVDDFFDKVMVMADDPAVRANRLALLSQLHTLMNQVADLSRLAA